MNAFSVVEQFEKKVAEFAGARYCVATMTGTWAIFLSLMRRGVEGKRVLMPARTFISVPNAVIHAGGIPVFADLTWYGVYWLGDTEILDGALRWKRNMYAGGLHCLSFHARKHINIGEGGAILTDDEEDAYWLRAARYSGRLPPHYRVEDAEFAGWQAYMTPEKAARGLHLMEYVGDEEDQHIAYPDLRQCPVFSRLQPSSSA